jgi:hypothetical protein
MYYQYHGLVFVVIIDNGNDDSLIIAVIIILQFVDSVINLS